MPNVLLYYNLSSLLLSLLLREMSYTVHAPIIIIIVFDLANTPNAVL